MRLDVVDHGHAPAEAAVLDQIRQARGVEPVGVLKTLYYRPELFGRPFSAALDVAMRGAVRLVGRPSGSSSPAYVSYLNECHF